MALKLSKFVHVNKQDNYTALFNYLNSRLVMITNSTDIDLFNNFSMTGTVYDTALFENLKRYDMIVDEEFDEDLMLNYAMNRYLYNGKSLEITLIPGQACNFRCLYCYEENDPPKITQETLARTTNFIKNMVDEYRFKEVKIFWFGGEPTLYKDLIIDYMNDLKNEFPDIRISGNMTTNGYLLDKQSFCDFYEVGIDTYQITLDCFAETHDMLRPLKTGGKTWHTIDNNLEEIASLSQKFKIILRINYNEYMIDDIFRFMDHIARKYDKRFLLHTHPIFNGDESKSFSDTMCDPSMELYFREAIIDYVVDNEILSDIPLILTSFGSQVCYAAKPNSYVIDEKGIIRKCTIALDKEFNEVGKIQDADNYSVNLYRLSKWTESRISTQKCFSCECRPACGGTAGCPKIFFSDDPNCGFNRHLANYYIDRLSEHLYSKRVVTLT